MTTTPTTTETARRGRLVEAIVESMHAMATADIETLRRVVHPEAFNRMADAEPPATRGRGPEAFLATSHWLRDAYSDLAFRVDDVVVEGDLIVTYGTMSGRHTGDFVIYDEQARVERAFAPTGRTFEVAQAHFFRIRDDRVVEHWAVRDDQGQAIQLGWIPPTPWYLLRCALATRRHRRRQATA